MPAKSIDPLKKITVDLYKVDLVWLKNNCENVTEEIRNLVHNHVTIQKAAEHRMTLGDLKKGFHMEGDTKVYHSYKDYADD